MNIEYLHEFFVLAYRLNFSAAAKELHMSQPTLSSHIAALEKELGATLFDRDSQSVSLTPAGKACLEDANDILSSYNNMLRHAKQYGSDRKRKVIIQTYADHRYLADCIQALEASPAIVDAAVEIELRNLPRTDFLSDVRDRWADLALVSNFYADLPAELTTRELEDEELAAIVSTSSPFADKPILSVRDLEGQKVVVTGMLDNHANSAHLSEILESLDISANITEVYYGSISDVYLHLEEDEIYIDAFVTSFNMPTTMANKFKVLRFKEGAMKFRGVAVYRKDNDNPWLGLVIDELQRMMVKDSAV